MRPDLFPADGASAQKTRSLRPAERAGATRTTTPGAGAARDDSSLGFGLAASGALGPGEGSWSATGDATAAPGGSAAAFQHERFRVGAKLGEGGMGVVYRARDTRDGREVALKVMKGSLAGTARRRFEREFRSLAGLVHPHCLQVFEFGEVEGGPFFTMDLFPGQPITSLADRPLDERLEPLLQVTLALDYIHHSGIIHRDVKPSNILVRPAVRPDGQPGYEAKLMDFGLAKFYGVRSSLSVDAGFVGTVAYCAPEQLHNDELDHRADLYCLGLVGYELLSGRYAFPEARLAGMRAQMNDAPRPLSEVCPELPRPIADALARYLRKEPRRRPDSAALLRDAIAAHLRIDSATVFYGPAQSAARPALTFTGFICRAREQESVEQALRHALSPAAAAGGAARALIVVAGEPGIGKSSLVREAERAARGHGCQDYQGRCFDGNLVPFQPFVEILRQLIAELRLQERREADARPDDDPTATHGAGLPVEHWARLAAVVNDYAGEILRVAPELRKYLPGEAYRQVDFGGEADYILRALAALFIEIATLQPLCLSFEDIQWADKGSLDLLRHLSAALAEARRTAGDTAAPPRLTLIASARAGDPQVEALVLALRERREVLELSLAPLSEPETRELIALRLNCGAGDVADDLVARAHALCEGNPFFVSETVREWFENAVIAREGAGWALATQDAERSDLPQTVREALRLRVQGLSAPARQVLGAAAVIGAVVDIDLLRGALPDLTESDVLDAIDVLLPRRVFRETGNPGQVQFVHDLLRELPYADLSATRRASLHRRVGVLLEHRRDGGAAVPAAILAEHFRQADDRAKAYTYTLDAAQAARDAYAFDDAIALLQEAQRLEPPGADDASRHRLWDMLGSASSGSGRLDDAITAYEHSFGCAHGRVARARARYGEGEAYHRKGDFDQSVRAFELALRETGYKRPQTSLGLLADMGRAAAVFHLLPPGVRLPGGAEREARLTCACAAYQRLCQIFGTRSVLAYSHTSYRFMAFARQLRSREMHAQAYAKLSLNCGMFGLSWLSRRFARVAVQAAAGCRAPHVVATAQAYLGCAYYYAARLAEAEHELREAVGSLDKVSDRFGGFAHHNLRHLYGIRADFVRELAEADREIASGLARGDRETTAWGRYGKAHALAWTGHVTEAERLADESLADLQERSTTIGIAYGVLAFVRLQASDYAGARVAAERGRAAALRAGCLYEYVAPIFPILVESLLGPRWAQSHGRSDLAPARKAWRESQIARLMGWVYPNYRPHALRVSGRAAFALGNARLAVRYLERAIGAAEALGARYDLARALLDAAIADPPRASEYRRRGEQLLQEIGGVVPEAERSHA